MSQREAIFDYEFDAYRVRTDDLTLRYRGAALPLAPKVAKTLIALLERPRQVVSKDVLLHEVWGDDAVEEANLSQNVYSLRRQFQTTSGETFIETLSRRGYRFNADVVKRAVVDPIAGHAPDDFRRARPWVAFAAASLLLGLALLVQAYPARAPDLPADAQRAYDLGWYYWRDVTPTGVRASIEQFDAVVRSAPGNALGYAAEAVDYAKLSDLESSAPSVGDAVSADEFAAEGVALDARSAVARGARGYVEWDIDGDNVAAGADLAYAVKADPNVAVTRMWYGDLLLWTGDVRLARAQLVAAADLDPTLPGLDYALGLDYYLSRDYADAAAFAKVGIADPWSSDESRLLLAAADDEAGRYASAIEALKPLPSSSSTRLAACGTLAHVYASMGDRGEARRELAVVERLALQFPGRPVLTALAYAANGLPDEAFAWLSRLPRSDRAVFGLDPRFESLHRDKRFAAWLHG